RVDRAGLADPPVAAQVVRQHEQCPVRDVAGDQLQPVAEAVVRLDGAEGLVLELLAEPAPEGLPAGEPVTAAEVDPAPDDLPGRREVLKVPEARAGHQRDDVLGVVPRGEVTGDDRAGTCAGDVHPPAHGLLGVLGEPEQGPGEPESLYTAASKDPVG